MKIYKTIETELHRRWYMYEHNVCGVTSEPSQRNSRRGWSFKDFFFLVWALRPPQWRKCRWEIFHTKTVYTIHKSDKILKTIKTQ